MKHHRTKCLLGLFAALLVGVENPPVANAADAAATPYEQRKDVVYGETSGVGLLMDVFVPTGKRNGLAVVDVVSGAWHSDRNKIRDHTLAQIFQIYCARGYVVLAARPGSKTRFSAQDMVGHVKQAIRYAKDQAGVLKYDPERLGITGASAGGHLALLAALSPEAARAGSKNPLERFSTDVAAVGVFFPPTDVLDWNGDGRSGGLGMAEPILFPGGMAGKSTEEIRAQARLISPLHQVTKTATPFLLIHGDADTVVPMSHSTRFVEAMKGAGNSVELIVKQGGGHPWLTLPQEVAVMADWFDRKLTPPAAK